MVKKLTGLIIAALLAFGTTLCTFAVEIEQVQAVMPNVDIYVYDEQLGSGDLPIKETQVYLDENLLEVVSAAPVTAADRGTFYVYMLDISASINRNYFWDIRQAILNNHYRLGENDRMALITFGDEVDIILSGGEDYEQVADAVDALECNDMTTHFYDAVDALIELCSDVDSMRKVAIVFSDGVNDAQAGVGTARTELMERLRGSGIALNAMCVDSGGSTDSNDEDIDEFASLARLNGGELYMFGDRSEQSAAEAVDSLYEKLLSCWLIAVRAESNIADGGEHSFRVSIGGSSDNYSLVLDSWDADDTAPYIVSAGYNSVSNTLDIVFSEPVSGSGEAASYDLSTSDNEHIAFAGVSVSGDSVSLSFAEMPYNGTYFLKITGISDISMEKNPLTPDTVEIIIEDGAVPEPTGLPVWAWFAIGGGVLIVIAVAVIVILYVRKKPVVITPPEYRPDESGHIRIKPGSGTRIGVELADGRGWQQYFELSIGSSLFVGRGEENDVIIDYDRRVSSQHFCLEYMDGTLFVTDLGSKNSTLLNGIAIRPDTRHKLDPGDIIRFGDCKMTIRAVAI